MRKLGIVVVVAAALAAFIQAAWLLGQMLFVVVAGGNLLPALVYVLPCLCLVAVGAALIWARRTLAERWFEDSGLEFSLDPTALVRVGLVLTGVVLAIQAISPLATRLYYVVAGQTADWWAFLVAYVAELVVAVVVVVWSAPLAARLLPPGAELNRRPAPPDDKSRPEPRA